MNLSGDVTTGVSSQRFLYSSWIPLLCTWMAIGPTRPALGSLNRSTSTALHLVAPVGNGQHAIRATPVFAFAMSSHCAHWWMLIFLCGTVVKNLPPPLLWPGR